MVLGVMVGGMGVISEFTVKQELRRIGWSMCLLRVEIL